VPLNGQRKIFSAGKGISARPCVKAAAPGLPLPEKYGGGWMTSGSRAHGPLPTKRLANIAGTKAPPSFQAGSQ